MLAHVGYELPHVYSLAVKQAVIAHLARRSIRRSKSEVALVEIVECDDECECIAFERHAGSALPAEGLSGSLGAAQRDALLACDALDHALDDALAAKISSALLEKDATIAKLRTRD